MISFDDIKSELVEKRDGKSSKDKGYSLRDWFKGGGWKQTGGKYDGKPCAKQPGQTTKPYCRDADDRASMSKDERDKRASKKRREDPNADRKGKAKNVTQEEVMQDDLEFMTEEQFDEAAGEKDACYHKVKARYSVWPSAYASGALVKCRKKGAKNWGNKTKKEEVENVEELYKGKHGQSEKEYMNSRSDAGKQISGDSKHSGAAYSHRSFKGQGKPAKPGERQKLQGKMTKADRDELAIRKANLKKEEFEFSNWRDEFKATEFEFIDLIKPKKIGEDCWDGYEKKGMKTMFGKRYPNCVKKKKKK